MKEKVKCCVCGAELVVGETAIEFDGQYLCGECHARDTVVCECCGDRIWERDSVDERLCSHCFDAHYVRCIECDAVIHENDAHYCGGNAYCDDCYDYDEDSDDDEYQFIADYSYKPNPIFYGSGQPHYGVELEIDYGGKIDNHAAQIMDTGNEGSIYIYCKSDGSLDDGFEIVSHPATLDYHLNMIRWDKIMEKARQLGYISHTAKTCGLHVHINRAALGETVEEQENTIGRIIYFFEKFWDNILCFSRRTEYQVQRWASRYGCTLENPKETMKSAKSAGLGRYVAVNLENTFTVELRIFRGTLRYGTFAATLQFVDKLCHDAINLSDEQFQTMTWSGFINSISEDKKELLEYLKIRGLEE